MAELYYLQRRIDCLTQYWDAERAIRAMKELITRKMPAESREEEITYKVAERDQWSLNFTKFYIKSLTASNEH